MEPRITAVTLGVKDLDTSRRFYEALGWKAGFVHEEVVFIQLGGVILALWGREDLAKDIGRAAPAEPGAGSLAHNVRSPAEVDQVLAQAKAAGARIIKPAAQASWGGTTGNFADPDGHPWEVAYNPGWTLLPDGTVRL